MWKITEEKFKAAMDKAGYTTYKIRKEKVIGEATLQAIRSGKSVNSESISRICDAFGCTPADLFEDVD